MKCIKNSKTGDIQRVSDKEAYNMVGNTWKYIPKSEWKEVTRVVVTEKQKEEGEKKEVTISEKGLKRKKLKEKQRA